MFLAMPAPMNRAPELMLIFKHILRHTCSETVGVSFKGDIILQTSITDILIKYKFTGSSFQQVWKRRAPYYTSSRKEFLPEGRIVLTKATFRQDTAVVFTPDFKVKHTKESKWFQQYGFYRYN